MTPVSKCLSKVSRLDVQYFLLIFKSMVVFNQKVNALIDVLSFVIRILCVIIS